MSANPFPETTHRGPSSVLRLVAGLFAFAALFIIGSLIAGATPADARIKGVDVSSWQHPNGVAIDWPAVRNAGYSFAITKATGGGRWDPILRRIVCDNPDYVNPWFAQDFAQSGAAGLYRGAYHFALPTWPIDSALSQARQFVATVGSLAGPLDLPAMLDLETNCGQSPDYVAQWARTWLAEVTRLTGKRPMIYTGYYFWRDSVGNPADMGSQYRLVIANYHCQRDDGSMFCDPNIDTFSPPVPAGWSTWTFWQYSSVEVVPGIVGGVDVNWFCCDLGTLAALGGSSAGAGNPFGNLESVTAGSTSAIVTGWALDPDTTAAIKIHVYVDGRWGGEFEASVDRPDVALAYRGFGRSHGFSASISVAQGSHSVCAYAINSGLGSGNTALGCRTIIMAGSDPFGSLDDVVTGPGQLVAISGWAMDLDTVDPIAVELVVDGVVVSRGSTTVGRPDVAAIYAGRTNSGYFVSARGVRAGSRQVCARAVNVGGVPNGILVGCRNVAVPGGNPFGSLDVMRAGLNTVTLRGWAIDVDASAPLTVRVTIDGVLAASTATGVSRPDVHAAFPTIGSNQGYSLQVQVPGGTHRICVEAVNVGEGSGAAILGCRDVTLPVSPFGSIDWMARAYGLLGVSGWGIDPEVTSPIGVEVTMNGTPVAPVTADRSRPDVAAAYPGMGDRHGYQLIWSAPQGPVRVCVRLLNAGSLGVDVLLTCRDL